MVELIPGFPIFPDDVVFDMGSGYGDLVCLAAKTAAHVIALDYDKNLLEEVAERLKAVPAKSFETILSPGGFNLPLASARASAIVCTEVLEHFNEPESLMAELVRIGQPGCRYYLSVPDATGERIAKFVAPPEDFQAPHHVQIFDRDRFRALVTDAGLVIDDLQFAGSYWTVWWILRHACRTHYHPGLKEEPPEIFRHWKRVWECLESTEEGRSGIAALDRAIPKSQIILAHKPKP